MTDQPRPQTTTQYLGSRLGGLVLMSRYSAQEIAARARAGREASLARQVDPCNELTEEERNRRIEAARRAHMVRISALAIASRQKKARRRRARPN